jgi:uncharacterized protein
MENKDNNNYSQYFDDKHNHRSYRQTIRSQDLMSFQVKDGESDLLIQSPVLLQEDGQFALEYFRSILKDYIKENPEFRFSLKPYPSDYSVHPMIDEMIEVSQRCQVGPMAAVAGCISQHVAEKLLTKTNEIIIENGGDIYLKSPSIRKAIIYAGFSPLSNKIYLNINSRSKGIGLCTSSGTVGPSFSMGKADAVTVISYSAALADAAATAIANIIYHKEDIKKGLKFAQDINGLLGVVIIKDDQIGMWGEIDYGLI